MERIRADIAFESLLSEFRPSEVRPFTLPKQYLLQLYSKNLTIVIDADLRVIWKESERILHLKVCCANFGRPRFGHLPYLITDGHPNNY